MVTISTTVPGLGGLEEARAHRRRRLTPLTTLREGNGNHKPNRVCALTRTRTPKPKRAQRSGPEQAAVQCAGDAEGEDGPYASSGFGVWVRRVRRRKCVW